MKPKMEFYPALGSIGKQPPDVAPVNLIAIGTDVSHCQLTRLKG